ncbi:MAG: hypothetical protein JO191_02785 [Mycobacteriaceae bacterium]|nr:hypothetical protein [Mycobacteriaceae bacterium]
MKYRITPDERASFKRCRRQWDFASPHRRDLQPVARAQRSVAAAVTDALAVYYYPGTWDWPHELTQSLVQKALERSLGDDAAPDALASATAILTCYDAWARTADDFAPIRIEHDVSGLVPDPSEPARGLTTADGLPVIYSARVELLAIDAADEYWMIRHQLVDDWQDIDALLRDEQAVAACWAWEQDYMGMDIAGTIHNEIRIGGSLELPGGTDLSNRVAQNEPSGGGRSIPQHRRIYARAAETHTGKRVEQRTAGLLRRTRIRRGREEIASVGAQLGVEALAMLNQPAIYPTPAAHCGSCEFGAPCLAMMAGHDAETLLTNGFRRSPSELEEKPRLGQATWGFGRGAAPPQW